MDAQKTQQVSQWLTNMSNQIQQAKTERDKAQANLEIYTKQRADKAAELSQFGITEDRIDTELTRLDQEITDMMNQVNALMNPPAQQPAQPNQSTMIPSFPTQG